MDKLLFDVLNRIADNLFLIRETLECMLPKPPEDDDDDDVGLTFYDRDGSFCGTCEHFCKHGWDFPCNDCKHVTAKKLADRYTPREGQHGADGNG